jgi:hypothetical protein
MASLTTAAWSDCAIVLCRAGLPAGLAEETSHASSRNACRSYSSARLPARVT